MSPIEPPPIYLSYVPILINGIVAIRLANSRNILDDHVFSPIFGFIRSFLSIVIALFAKPSTLGKKPSKRAAKATKAQRIKPGVSYQWDEETRRWIPLKRTPVLVEPTPTEQQSEHPEGFALIWPLEAGFILTQDFQDHARAKAEHGYKYYNGGLDLAYQAIWEGAPVYAAAVGILKSASFSGEGYGNIVYIDHLNGYVTIYAHLHGFGKFSAGHAVKAGDVIGQLGHTGNCQGGPGNPDGTHLHFELRYLGAPVDPLPFIDS